MSSTVAFDSGLESALAATVRDGLDVPLPCAVVDLDAFDANAASMVTAAAGRPIRVVTKSVRCRPLLERVVRHPGYVGVMCYSLREALWLADQGHDDLLVAYPSTDRPALERLARDESARAAIAVTIDDPAHLELVADALGAVGGARVRVVIDVDASLRIGRQHLGARRSPLHDVEEVLALARAVLGSHHAELDGLLFYEAQIAGVDDRGPAIRLVKRRSAAELARRRSDIIEAVEQAAGRPLELVNGGGTGSLHITGRTEPGRRGVTELAAGSGLYAPTLFDGYRDLALQAALFLVTCVTRIPAPHIVTVAGGGIIASGRTGPDHAPTPVAPAGLRLLSREGAGEVQTPLRRTERLGRRDGEPVRIGDRVWLRPAKAGETCERFDRLYLIAGGQVVDEVPTYRGEGRNFG